MKTLLVTSEVTYVPRNYNNLFETLCKTSAHHLAGLVILKTGIRNLFKQSLLLYASGAHKTAYTLMQNLVALPLQRREQLFKKQGIPVLRAQSMNQAWIINWVIQHDIDLIVNLRTRCIYGREILNIPRFGCINIHHGLLPQYRGLLCDLQALSEGRPAGFTIHKMTEKINAGTILSSQVISPGTDRDYMAYLSRTGRHEALALSDLLEHIDQNRALPQGKPNRCVNPVCTRTPNRMEIRRLQAMGMVL